MDTKKVTRVVIIDHTKSYDEGGAIVYHFGPKSGVSVELSMQDDDRTLKVFIGDKPLKGVDGERKEPSRDMA